MNSKNKSKNKNRKKDNVYISASRLSTDNNRTGSWRYLSPVAKNKISPCEAECPLSVPIPEFIYEIERENIDEATRLIMYENPMPSICGRVCIHPCEERCNRLHYDSTIAIHRLERHAGDHFSPEHLPLKNKNNKRIAVVGAGPAGLTAAYFLLIMGYNVSIYEARDKPGGVLRYGIPGYRLPDDVLNSALENILCMEPDLKTGMALGDNLAIDDLKSYDGVFIGTGAGNSGTLILNSQENEDVIPGLELLEQINSGDYKLTGSRVIIVGGGNTAIDVARSVLRLGAKPVILYRREIDDMPAFSNEVREAVSEGVEIRTGVTIKEIFREEGKISGVNCVKVDKDSLNEISGSEYQIKADMIVSAIGGMPDLSQLMETLKQEKGKVVIDNVGRTSISNVFAGGDLVPQPHLVVHAMASGKQAAIAMDAEMSGLDPMKVRLQISVGTNGVSFKKYMDLKEELINGKYPDDVTGNDICGPESINYSYFPHIEGHVEKTLSLKERRKSFKEVHMGYTGKKAQVESARCFTCGICTQCCNCVVFCPDLSVKLDCDEKSVKLDYDYCKGCGICAEECPRGVIKMIRKEVK